MPRKKETQGPSSPKEDAGALPPTRLASELNEESGFSDYPDSFFTDGTVKSLAGTSNVLIVAPNMSPDTDDKNMVRMAYWLAEELGGYAVINCGRYRRPAGGDPTPEELNIPRRPGSSRKEKKTQRLRQQLLDDTGGIPVDITSFGAASEAAQEYVDAIARINTEIGNRAIPLFFFVWGIDDARADELGLDVAVGAGYRLNDRKWAYSEGVATANRSFVEDLIGRLSLIGNGIRVQEGVDGYALTGDKDIPLWVQSDWVYKRNRPSGDAFRAEDISAVLITIRCTGFRDNTGNVRRTVEELAGAISRLSLFRRWQENEMEKKTMRKSKKPKAEKASPSESTEKTVTNEQPSGTSEGDVMTAESADLVQTGVALISKDRFQEKIQALRDQATIKNDKDEDVAFDGEAKENFISAFEQAYPVIERALSSIHELGTFLLDVRKALKPHKLYYAWLDYAGIPRRTAANYVQVCDRYKDSLSKFAYLGIKKLLTASSLKECVDYVEKNEQAIAEQSAAELQRAVNALRSRKKKTATGRGRKPTYIEIGKCRIRPSKDGTKLLIEGISKKKQDQLIAAIKGVLS